MKTLDDIQKTDIYERHPHYETCEECGYENKVLTQDGLEHCEYMTIVYVKCSNCDNAIKFHLPVN